MQSDVNDATDLKALATGNAQPEESHAMSRCQTRECGKRFQRGGHDYPRLRLTKQECIQSLRHLQVRGVEPEAARKAALDQGHRQATLGTIVRRGSDSVANSGE